MKSNLRKEIKFKSPVQVQVAEGRVTVKGPKGAVVKNLSHPKVVLTVDENRVVLESAKATKREKKMVGTFASHLKNMVRGVEEPFVYKMKICSGHFPMNVAVAGQELTIKNFFGESVPRKISFLKGVDVKVSGTEITVVSADKELAGQTVAKIESLCRIKDKDIRIFQDGCYVVQKAGKEN